jgi:D-alanyl-D-alanine carboxypeptidase
MSFRIASNTKVFVAMALLKLVDLGVISPTDLISSYIPNPFPGSLKNWNSITIQELANHTSGLSDYAGSSAFLAVKNASPYASWTPLQLLSYAQDLNYLPGAGFTYANTNFVILGMLVEIITGDSLENFIQEEFTRPMGLTHTGFALSGSNPDLVCQGYSGTTNVTLNNPSWAAGAGQMVSTAPELAKWIRAVGSGKLLSAYSQKTLLNEVVPSSFTGFGVEEYNYWMGHTGRIDGFSTACFYNPTVDACVVVMVNREDGTDGTNNVHREIPILNDVINAFFPSAPFGNEAGD